VQDLTLDGAGHMLDFIVDNNVAISKDDYHLNERGHQLWSDQIYNYIKNLNA
jgi:lysophospholipase L1-like esterase